MDVAIDHVKLKAKEDLAVQRYQVMKRKPQSEAQARKNIMMYLKNDAGFKLDYFKGMSYDDIRPIFEAKFNSNIAFLLNTKEQMEEKENRALQTINETPSQKAAKKRKLNEEVEDLKRHLEIVPERMMIADGTHQLYISFLTLLKNFDKEDLEALWSLVKEWFSTSKPKNFSDDFLLTTLGAIFEKPDAQAQVWKNQRTIHGQSKTSSKKHKIPYDQRNNPPQHPRTIYPSILDINYFSHFLDFLQNYNIMNDEPMWATDCVVALTLDSAITIPETANEFAIKGDHLTLVKGNQFYGRTKTDPHKHIHEFLEICDMFKYRDTEKEAIHLMMFPISLIGEAKTWLDEFNKGTIETSFQCPVGIAENMLVEVGIFTFPVDFVILEMEEDRKKQLNLGVGTERMIFNINSVMKHSSSNDDTCFIIDVIDEILEEYFEALLDEGSKILHSIEGTLLKEEIFSEFDEYMAMTADENSKSESNTEEPSFKKITIDTDYKIKTSLK
nr:reverse transcriptase domain-containing protein [Tanacetum cinerariifolium]